MSCWLSLHYDNSLALPLTEAGRLLKIFLSVFSQRRGTHTTKLRYVFITLHCMHCMQRGISDCFSVCLKLRLSTVKSGSKQRGLISMTV